MALTLAQNAGKRRINNAVFYQYPVLFVFSYFNDTLAIHNVSDIWPPSSLYPDGALYGGNDLFDGSWELKDGKIYDNIGSKIIVFTKSKAIRHQRQWIRPAQPYLRQIGQLLRHKPSYI